jgi:hypothetical protein
MKATHAHADMHLHWHFQELLPRRQLLLQRSFASITLKREKIDVVNDVDLKKRTITFFRVLQLLPHLLIVISLWMHGRRYGLYH